MGDGGYARLKYDLVQGLIEQHGEGAYTYVLERIAKHEGDNYTTNLWRKVLIDLDEHFKQGEVK